MKRGNGSTLVAFINATMKPTRYVQDHARLDSLQGELNAVLVLYGFRVTDQGQLVWGATASTLSEAAQISWELLSELRRRGWHDALLL